MSTLSGEDILFVGVGATVVAWYRTGMPALELGCDWFGVRGEDPHNLEIKAAISRTGDTIDWDRYKIVVLQQVRGNKWMRFIRELQQKGITVFYEIDDYISNLYKLRHEVAHKYPKSVVREYELCMAVCDGLLTTTEYIARKYAKFTKTHVCRNGVDVRRLRDYRLPERPTINIGWAGGIGHADAVRAWLPAIRQILHENEDVRFISLGMRFADEIDMPGRTVSLPAVAVECFHAALCNFDIALGPAGRNALYKGKSDLRWLETGALGIPLVADPFVYKDVRDGEDGILAVDADDAYWGMRKLVKDPELRAVIGSRAKARVSEERSIEAVAPEWIEVFLATLPDPCTPAASSSSLSSVS